MALGTGRRLRPLDACHFLGSRPEHEVWWEASVVTFDLLIESLGHALPAQLHDGSHDGVPVSARTVVFHQYLIECAGVADKSQFDWTYGEMQVVFRNPPGVVYSCPPFPSP